VPPIVHWDEVESRRADDDALAATWTFLGDAAGTLRTGLSRIQVDSGNRSTPAHVHQGEEEIFYVLAGEGLSWQDERTYEIRAGDCLVHRAGTEAHTLIAGKTGLDVLAFGTRAPAAVTFLPRASAMRLGRLWTRIEALSARPTESAELDLPEPSPRPPRIVNVADCPTEEWRLGEDMGAVTTEIGATAGSRLAGLNQDVVPSGLLNTAPHFHSAEEEIFVILDGAGTLLLGEEEHPVRRGHVVARPPGTKVSHAFRGGDYGLTVLLYGTREPSDITYYPRSSILALRGVGVIGRIDRVSPDDIF
jgi:uncharacterized cupin superfamily protein